MKHIPKAIWLFQFLLKHMFILLQLLKNQTQAVLMLVTQPQLISISVTSVLRSDSLPSLCTLHSSLIIFSIRVSIVKYS